MKTRPRLQLLLVCLLLALVSQQLFSFMARLVDEAHYASERVEVTNKLGRFRLTLEQRLNATFYVTQGIEILISTLNLEGKPLLSQQKKIAAWAEEATIALPYIKNVAVTEGYVIRFTYPAENSALIGYDYRKLPDQWPAVERAVKSKLPVVAGPLALIQGGTGILSRIPLYTHDKDHKKQQFLGIISLLVDDQALLKSSGLDQAEAVLNIAIRGKDGLGEAGDVFYGDSELFSKDNISQRVSFLGGDWILAAEPKSGWSYASPYSKQLKVLGYFISLLIAVLLYFALRANQLRLQDAENFSKKLEQRVAERTEQLMLAKNEAVHANQAKSEFLAVITHELRTPLNSILGLSQLIETMKLDKLQRNYIAKVISSANLLLSLINNILSYTKVESGNIALEQQAFAISDIMQKLHDVFDVSASNKGLQFEVNIDTDVPTFIECDKGKLLQVLTNLCGNAIKFTEQGQVSIQVSQVPSKPGEQGYLRFVVSDTGIGIAAQHQQLIFEPFKQIDSTVARQYQGTGLGLSICQRFVELMAGSITVTSELGKGSQFIVEIPVHEVANASQPKTAPAQNLRATIDAYQPLLQGMVVILAEDNRVNQTFAVALLNKVGVTAKVAEDGLEVLALLEQTPVHGILMDLQMPKMDGLTASKKIREDKRFQGLPIIAMTANAMPEDEQQVKAAGMDGFVAKPINFEHLLSVLAQHLQADKQYPKKMAQAGR